VDTPRTIQPSKRPTSNATPPTIRRSIFIVWFRFNFFGLARKNRQLAARSPNRGQDLPDRQAKGNAPGVAGRAFQARLAVAGRMTGILTSKSHYFSASKTGFSR